jgi:PAS domain S-box-containing protein
MPSGKQTHKSPRLVGPSRRSLKIKDSKPGKDESKIHADRYRVLIEDVADGFYEVDLSGNFKFFNNALCRIFGYPRNQIQDRNFRQFMDEKNTQIAYEAFNRIYRSGAGTVGIKWEIVRPGGERRYLEISANLIVADDGQKLGFRGIARDVTDSYLAQRALKESETCALELSQTSRRAEQRYRALLEFLPDPVFAFNMDSTVAYLNPAFEKVFGWTFKELEGKIVPFVPGSYKEQTRQGIQQLFSEKVLHGFETKRLTKDGRLLDIIIDGAIFYDENNQPAGQVVTLRDVTDEKRNVRINQALFRIAKVLHQYRGLDERLGVVTKEVQDLLDIEGAMVILLDEEKKEFFFREAAFDDRETGQKLKELRFPADKGVAGHVYRTGKPLIIHDTSKTPLIYRQVDEHAHIRTRSMLDVPLQIQGRMIGVLCAINKKEGQFDQTDVELLTAIANFVALPIENAGINEALKQSYQEVQSLNRAKDRVIHHLSHELQTPISILAASLNLLKKRLSVFEDSNWQRILERAQRNLDRLLDMQYKIEDILREKHYQTFYLLSALLDACADELEVLVTEELGEKDIIQRLRRRINELFGPQPIRSEEIELDDFVKKKIRALRPRFAHRKCRVQTRVSAVPTIWLPRDVLDKIVEGLVRNAVENTPDGGRILVSVRRGEIGPELEVKDNGIGISAENQRLIFDNYFTAYDTMQYASRKPYDFGAGGKGFDLLRMKIFSERYRFKLRMHSNRCVHARKDVDACPGRIEECNHVSPPQNCHDTGGTTVTVQFHPADFFQGKESGSDDKS